MARAGRPLPPGAVRGGDRLIFVTLGTHGQPFHRAVELIAGLDSAEEILIQHGSTPPWSELSHVRWVEYLEYEALRSTMEQADVVICHAGVGSTVTAIRSGKLPVLLPRLGSRAEHVDDHQLKLATRFAQRGLALVCGTGDDLEALVEQARRRGAPASLESGHALAQAVAQAALDR